MASEFINADWIASSHELVTGHVMTEGKIAD
jgi:hypothetical protein